MAKEAGEAVNEEVVSGSTATDSASVENESPEAVDEDFDLEDSFDDGESFEDEEDDSEAEEETDGDEPEEVEKPEEEKAEETETEEPPQSKADERKQQLNEEIRDLVSQRNALRQEVEKANAEAYQPATEDQLLEQVNPDTGQYYNRLEAKLEAMTQQQDVARYNEQVAEAQLTIGHESQRVIKEFPMFNPKSVEFQPEVAAQAAEILKQNLVHDQNTGQIIGSHISPYKFYKTIADASKASAAKGQVAGQKATEKMLANADPVGGASQSTKKKSDPDMDGFDEEANRW